MDRSNKYGSFEQGSGMGGSQHSGVDYYRQSNFDHDQQGGGSAQWGYIATGALMLGLGGYFVVQGMRGRSRMPFMSGGDSSMHEMGSGMKEMAKGSRDAPGVQVREQITVNRPIGELYRFWRNVENLPRVMSYLESVKKSDDRHSHWTAKAPAGGTVEWDAEITDARENELVAWRSLEGSQIPNEGSVRFSRSSDGTGTVIDVALTYHPPGGKAGAAVAKLFGREPAQEVRRDLEKFKQQVESGNMILASGSAGSSFGV